MQSRTCRGAFRSAAFAVLCSLLLLLAWTTVARAQDLPARGTITVVHQVVPTTDTGRFDLAVDGVTLGTAMAGGSSIGPLPVDSGPHTVAESASAGTAAAGYTTTVTCVDGATTLVAAVAATSAAFDVAEGGAVVCTFTNTAVPTAPAVVAPPVVIGVPILLPPPVVRGIATLRGVEGCTAARVVTSHIVALNALNIRFYRDGRLVKEVRNGELKRRAEEIRTLLAPNDLRMHVVTVRIRFITGARPQFVNLVHRFGHCRQSAVVG